MPQIQLTPAQRKVHRADAHHLDPVVLVGGDGLSPSVKKEIDAALKGLPGETSVYHYTTPASHLLVGPAGIWVIVASTALGKVGYSKNRWRISGGGFAQTFGDGVAQFAET